MTAFQWLGIISCLATAAAVLGIVGFVAYLKWWAN